MNKRVLCFALAALLPPSAAHATETSAGPIEQAAPPGAVFANDDAELSRLVAEGPAEIWLHARTYRGALSVKRPVAIRGLRGATLEGPASGTAIRVEADGATLDNLIVRATTHNLMGEDAAIKVKGEKNVVRNLRVEGTLVGVFLESCHNCLLEGTFIKGPDVDESLRGDGVKLWESHDSVVRHNYVERVRDVVVWYSRRVLCEDNTVKNSRYGTHFMYAHDGIARRSTLRDNVVGVFVMYSSRLHVEGNVLAGAHGAAGVGIGFKESDGVVVTGNSIVGNTTGVYLDRTPRDPRERVTFANNTIGVNDLALRVHGAAKGIGFEGNSFRHNGELVEVDGGNTATTIDFTGNHYSEYAGYDLDGDGFGDVAFTHGRLSTAVVQDNPSVRFLHGTVALELVDVIAKAFPLLEKKPLLIDEKPRMKS